MTKLHCTYIGPITQSALEQNSSGCILGVFHKGCYIKWDTHIILLCDSSYGQIPFGICIDEYESAFKGRKEWEGKTVELRGQDLVFPNIVLDISCPGKETTLLEYDITLFQRNELLVESVLAEDGTGFLRHLLPVKKELCRGDVPKGTFDDLYTTKAAEKLHDFFCAMNANDCKLLRKALQKMQGFGYGLTPSMDDWLMGFLYVLNRRHDSDKVRLLCEEVVEGILDRTNCISAEYTISAAEKYSFSLFDEVLYEPNRASVQNMLKVGHSSGSDILTGMLFAVCYEPE